MRNNLRLREIKTLRATIAFLTTAILVGCTAPTPSPPRVATDSYRSGVLVFSGTSTGSGVMISRHQVLTAGHVVADDDSTTIAIKFSDGTGTSARVAWRGEESVFDVAVLDLDHPGPAGGGLGIRCSRIPLGSTVSILGQPGSLGQLVLSTASVVGHKNVTRESMQSYTILQAPILSGASGSAVIDAQGLILGVIDTALLSRTHSKDSVYIGMAMVAPGVYQTGPVPPPFQYAGYGFAADDLCRRSDLLRRFASAPQ